MVFYNVARQLANLKNIVAPGTFLDTCSGVKLSLLLLLYRGMCH